MQDRSESDFNYVIDSPKYRVARTTFLVICSASLLAVGCMLFNVYRLQVQVAALQSDTARSHGLVLDEMTKVREMSTFVANNNRHTMKSMREELEEAREQATASAGQARTEAQTNIQRLTQKIVAEEARQRELHEQVKKQVDDAREIAAKADAHVDDVRNEVGTVKHEVAQTQTSMTKAFSELRRVMGDMGIMSGRIATNQRELDILKSLGDRNYTEFRIVKSKEAQTVNGVKLALKKTDPSAHRYTLDLAADDIRVQKRDRSVNEPLQFYVGNKKQPYEIVVNSVSKNEVVGYMATPKLELDRN